MTAKEVTIEKEAKSALNNIIDYMGADKKFRNNATLVTYIERAIKRTLGE